MSNRGLSSLTRRTTVRWLALLLVLAATLLPGLSANPAAASRWRIRITQVQGQFITQAFGGPDCFSPVGTCSRGTVTGNLAGDVLVTITGSELIGPPTAPTGNRYTADITITTPSGNLYGTINGRVRFSDGALNSVVRFHRGTGDYDGAQGWLFVLGNFNFQTGAERDFYFGYVITRR